jgi:hypothetical protein
MAPPITRAAIERLAERKIRAAIEAGEFADLPGTGKPIPGIDEPYDPDWWIKSYLARQRASLAAADRQLARLQTLRERTVRPPSSS